MFPHSCILLSIAQMASVLCSVNVIPIKVHFYPVLDHLNRHCPSAYLSTFKELSKSFEPLLNASMAFRIMLNSDPAGKDRFINQFDSTLQRMGCNKTRDIIVSQLKTCLNSAGALAYFLPIIDWPESTPSIKEHSRKECWLAFQFRVKLMENVLKKFKCNQVFGMIDRQSTIRILELDIMSFLHYIRENYVELSYDAEMLVAILFKFAILNAFSFEPGLLIMKPIPTSALDFNFNRLPYLTTQKSLKDCFRSALALRCHHRYRLHGNYPLEDYSNYRARLAEAKIALPPFMHNLLLSKIESIDEVFTYEGHINAQLHHQIPFPQFLCQSIEAWHYALRISNLLSSFLAISRKLQSQHKLERLTEAELESVLRILFKDLNDFKSRLYAGLDTRQLDSWVKVMLAHLHFEIPTMLPLDAFIITSREKYILAMLHYYSAITNIVIISRLNDFVGLLVTRAETNKLICNG